MTTEEARRQGAAEEAALRDEGISPDVLELRDCLEALARGNQAWSVDPVEVVTDLMRIYAPDRLRRGYRPMRGARRRR